MEVTDTDNDINTIVEKISLTDQFENIMNTLSNFRLQVSQLQQQVKHIEKNVKRELKNLKKEAEKNKPKGNKKPSGFAIPTKVTNELCEFMDKEKGSEIARTVVTKSLISYIKNNKLENNENSQLINPDEKLKNLLGISENDKLTYFTLQKFMNKHFIKNEKQTIEL